MNKWQVMEMLLGFLTLADKEKVLSFGWENKTPINSEAVIKLLVKGGYKIDIRIEEVD